MLKVKRIAKVMLCIFIAFSMFISVNADNYSITVNNIEFIEGTPSDSYKRSAQRNNLEILYYFTYDSTPSNIKILSNNDIELLILRSNTVKVEYNIINIPGNATIKQEYYYNNLIYTISSIIYCKPDNGICEFNIMFDDEILNITSYAITKIEQPPINNAVININNTNVKILEILTSIFNFVTDKPWIILLGVSVSLISFLIYKAKTII